eukprot:553264_1
MIPSNDPTRGSTTMIPSNDPSVGPTTMKPSNDPTRGPTAAIPSAAANAEYAINLKDINFNGKQFNVSFVLSPVSKIVLYIVGILLFIICIMIIYGCLLNSRNRKKSDLQICHLDDEKLKLQPFCKVMIKIAKTLGLNCINHFYRKSLGTKILDNEVYCAVNMQLIGEDAIFDYYTFPKDVLKKRKYVKTEKCYKWKNRNNNHNDNDNDNESENESEYISEDFTSDSDSSDSDDSSDINLIQI